MGVTGRAVMVQRGEIDMEEEFLNLGLDIIGLGVFNYTFGSGKSESPVIKASAYPHWVLCRNRSFDR